MELLHFTGQVWRPPYEASSQLLQVTAGCTHNKCKFCSLYHGTKFRLSPITEVEEDLKVIQDYQPRARRVFLTGANPFALSYNRLLDLGLLSGSTFAIVKASACFPEFQILNRKP